MAGVQTPYDRRLNALGDFGHWAMGIVRSADRTMTLEEFVAECETRIEAMRALGRTQRWQNTLTQYHRMVANALNEENKSDPWRYADWAVIQYGIYAGLDAQ